MVPWKATALKRWTVTDRRWRMNPVSRVSPDIFVRRRPISEMKSRPSLLRGPRGSRATGTKAYLLCRSAYLVCILVAANSAALPASVAVSGMYDAATVSTTVASPIKVRPLPHVIRVWPSGLLPSDLVRPDGSLTAGGAGSVEAAVDDIVDGAVSSLTSKPQMTGESI